MGNILQDLGREVSELFDWRDRKGVNLMEDQTANGDSLVGRAEIAADRAEQAKMEAQEILEKVQAIKKWAEENAANQQVEEATTRAENAARDTEAIRDEAKSIGNEIVSKYEVPES